MNENELITAAVRESVTGIHSATPVEQVMERSRVVRARRRIPRVAGTLAVAGVTALSVTALVHGGSPVSHQAPATLAAWTVARQADGDISVTVRELRDPAGLQATLRADGVPVKVDFSDQPWWHGTGCQPYNMTGSDLLAVVRFRQDVLVIRPSAIPSGAGLAIIDNVQQSKDSDAGVAIAVSLVYASQECTG